jgi:energy-coupling factor transporter ATP-binding protein EcfA2
MGKKVASVSISNFRGISAQLSLSFAKNANARGKSALIYGENGSGKSSVVDALEFATRGVVSRRTVGGKKEKRELRHLMGPAKGPRVDITFDDGTIYSRGPGPVVAGGSKLSGRSFVPGFQFCPLVIRRRDIDGFWTLPESARQSLFFDYLRDLEGEFLDETARKRSAEIYLDALEKHEQAVSGMQPFLSNWSGVLPEHTGALAALQRHLKYIYGSGNDRSLPQEVQAAFNNYSQTLEARNLAAAAGKQALALGPTDRRRFQEILTSVAAKATQDFRTVTDIDWLTDIKFSLVGETGIKIELITGGKSVDPTQILSEASLDLLALLIFTEVHIECISDGQEEIIIFDDVFQSVDRSLRMRTLEHLTSRLKGWQIILTLHDRLWLEMAHRALVAAKSEHDIFELRRTRASEEVLLLKPATGPLRDLEHCIATQASATLLAGAAGRALEAILEEATQYLSTKIRRKPDDKYTINDLWQPLRDDFALCENNDQIPKIATRIENSRFLRNSIGAHYNTAAEGISDLEILDFAGDVVALRKALVCHCDSPFKRTSASGGKWSLAPTCRHKN